MFSPKTQHTTKPISSKPNGGGSFIQPKLNVGKPGDKYEVEADRAADKIVAKGKETPNSFFAPTVQKKNEEEIQKQESNEQEVQQKPLVDSISPVVQLASENNLQKEEEEVQKSEDENTQQVTEENLQAKEDNTTSFSNELIQQKPEEEIQEKEEEEVQEKEEEEVQQLQMAGGDDNSSLEGDLSSSKGGGSSLPSNTQNEMESGFGADFSGVRIHNDSNAVQMNKKLGSQAFTNGNDIYFNEGKYNPSSESGKHLLAHELTHTVQQGASPANGVQAKMESDSSIPQIQKQEGEGNGNQNEDQQPDNPQNDQNSNTQNENNQSQTNNQQGNQNGEGSGNQNNTQQSNAQQNSQNNNQSSNNQPSNNSQQGNQNGGTNRNQSNNQQPNNPQNDQVPNTQNSNNQQANNEQRNQNAGQSNQQGGPQTTAGDPPVVFPTFEAFTSFVQKRKQAVENFYTEQNAAVDNFIRMEQERAINEVNAQITRLQTAQTQVVVGVNRKFNEVKTAIETKRANEIENARENARLELERIDQITRIKQETIRSRGESKAQAVLDGAGEQVSRLNSSTTEKENEVGNIIRRKSRQYSGRDNADQVTQSAWDTKSDTVGKIRESGNTIRDSITTHSRDLARNYREDSSNIALKFGETSVEARERVIENRDETITALRDAGQESIDSLRTETTNLVSEVNRGINEQISALRGIPQRIREELYDVEIHVKAKLREDKAKSIADIDEFAKDVGEIYWHRDEVAEAQEDLNQAITDQENDVTTFVEDANGRLITGVTSFINELVSTQNTVIPSFTRILTDYITAATRLQTDVFGVIDEVVRDSADASRAVGDELETGFDDKISEEETRWDSQLDDDLQDMRDRVSDGISEQENILERFESNLDAEFNKGDDFWSFVRGVFAGFWEGFTSLLSAIWEAMGTLIFWIVVLVVVLIIVFLVVVVGITLAAIGKVLLIIGIVIGIIAFVYFLVAAIVTEGLTPYERGRLLGKGLFELAFGLIGTGVYAKLMGWIPRIASLVTIFSRIQRILIFLRLVLRSKDLKALIRIIDAAQDLVGLLKILAKTNFLDDMIRLLDQAGDLNRIIRVLVAVDDVDALFLLIKNADDIGQILTMMERAIALGKGNTLVRILSETTELTRLLQILARSGDDFGRVIKVLEDAPELNQMILAMTKAIDELPRFLALASKEGTDLSVLAKLFNSADDTAALFKTLEGADDLAKSMRILDSVDNLNTLLRVLNDADDLNRVLLLFDNVTDFNLLVEVLGRTNELPKLLTYLEGRANNIDDIVRALQQLGGELDDFLRLMDEPSMSLFRMDSLLFMDNFTVARFRTLLAHAGGNLNELFSVLDEIGDLQKMIDYITHFTDFQSLKQVVDKAKASNMTIIVEFLDACVSDGFKNWAHLEEFFNRAVAAGVSTPSGWRDLISYARNFIAEGASNFTAYPGRTTAGTGGVASKVFTLSDGTTLTVTVEAADIFHYISRHTWKYFRLTMGNVEDLNGMWQVGTGVGDVRRIATDLLNHADLQTFIGTMLSGQNRVKTGITVSGVIHDVRVNLNGVNGLVSIYPIGGTGVISLSKDIMKAAVRLFLSI
ncbi:eCIS core domain-containing protein [Tenacibaculum mesophilum]|uniref:eCIS core domain-containing protein n=1 Tax=Tenacibaculum mesophilum TaxID=104268 RepID=UPI003F6102EA